MKAEKPGDKQNLAFNLSLKKKKINKTTLMLFKTFFEDLTQFLTAWVRTKESLPSTKEKDTVSSRANSYTHANLLKGFKGKTAVSTNLAHEK